MNGHSCSSLVKASAAALVVPLLLASCGTRLGDAEFAVGDTGDVAVTQTAAGGAPLTNGAATTPGLPVVDAGAPGTTPAPAQAGATTTGAETGVTAAGKGVSPAPGTAGAATATAAGPNAPCAKTLDPISLGQNGVFSGLTQSSLQGSRPGLAAWAADVNSRGGVQCHPIRLFQTDDGSNPSRTVSNTKDLIQNKHVVAMIAPAMPFNVAAYRSVVSPAGIPTIGGDNIDPAWDVDPLMYPTGVTVLPGMALAMRSAAEASGKTKWAVIYCVEAAACTATNDTADKLGEQAGVQIVNKQSISLTQTDYTSNCQTAKNAGAEGVLAVFDGSALIRFARSCAAIGYFPPAATLGLAIGTVVTADPNVQKETVTTSVTSLPYFSSSIGQVATFQAVMKKYAPSIPPDNSSMLSYTAGRLFEAALARVYSEARSGPVTTAMILKGVNSIKGEDLGGLLAAPLTFKAGQPHPAPACAFVTVVQTGGISDPRKGKPICLAGAGSANSPANSPAGSAGRTAQSRAADAPVADLRTGGSSIAARRGRRS